MLKSNIENIVNRIFAKHFYVVFVTQANFPSSEINIDVTMYNEL